MSLLVMRSDLFVPEVCYLAAEIELPGCGFSDSGADASGLGVLAQTVAVDTEQLAGLGDGVPGVRLHIRLFSYHDMNLGKVRLLLYQVCLR